MQLSLNYGNTWLLRTQVWKFHLFLGLSTSDCLIWYIRNIDVHIWLAQESRGQILIGNFNEIKQTVIFHDGSQG